ncbi:MAG TPA: hypothetical protein PLF42_08920, partial [Anaerolineales bacterium]|nr:hypothetical protein [Anaerolineales bacterium]
EKIDRTMLNYFANAPLGLYFLKYKKELATPEKILLRKYTDTLWMKFGIKNDEVLFTEEEYKDVRLSNKTISKRSV